MKIPSHIAIIMDGNGRWAKKKGLQRADGHKQGVKTLKSIVTAAAEMDINSLTVYAFSTENWRRPEREVEFLFNLFARTLRKEGQELAENNVVIKIIGRRNELPEFILDEILNLEELTAENDGLQLNIAFNYGGRAEIIDTAKKLFEKYDQQEITEDLFSRNLYIENHPEVELLIRTGGEKRLSNFLLWECAYSELYFSEKYWPEFGKRDLKLAIEDYGKRDRRFGGID